MSFSTAHSALIKVPQDGFTLDDLKVHMRKTKVPAGARLTPTLVGNAMEDVGTNDEFAFKAEWVEEE